MICKVADLEEIIKRMEYLIEIHPNNNVWVCAKENAVRGYNEKSRVMYIGVLDGKIICEATAYIDEKAFVGDIQDIDGLLSEKRVYLSGFRTNKEYEGKGYFSKLYRYMENDLKEKGYRELCLGVEPSEVRNMQIYFRFGFINYIKTSIEYLPAKDENSKPKQEIINYYYKEI